jgi:signal transduction histidine kinase
MSLRERLTLAIVSVLILFSVNVGTYSWSNNTRTHSMGQLRLAVSGQLEAATIKQNLLDLHKAILLLSSLRSTLQETLTPQEVAQAISEISTLQSQLQELGISSAGKKVLFDTLKSSFIELTPLWKNFYRNYNNQGYDHYAEGDLRELLYRQVISDLDSLDKGLVKLADRQALDIKDIESVTNKITITVFLFSIILTIGLGVFLIRYTNSALAQLKEGSLIIGGGNLEYRIPVVNKDELGEVAKAFNTMSAKMQNAIKEATHAKELADLANQSKSSFLANMSHELRTPLNAIIGYSEMMLEDIELNEVSIEEQTGDLEKVLTAGRHLLTQINDVLDFSKIESGMMTIFNEEFDSIAMLKDVVTTVQPLAQKNHNHLVLEHTGDYPPLFNDVTKFRQIFYNLLSNACKFTQNGKIILRSELINAHKQVTIRFTVIDNGIGMTPEQTRIIFDPFVQADSSTTRKYGGTGLGLALCKQYCELMGGHIEARSTVENGTSFSVEFSTAPAVNDKSIQLQQELLDTADILDKTTILVIDDDPVALALTERFLHRGNYETVLVDNGNDAIKIAIELKPDVILLDLMMPVVDGWTVLSVLKENLVTQNIPVILLSMLDVENLNYHMVPLSISGSRLTGTNLSA